MDPKQKDKNDKTNKNEANSNKKPSTLNEKNTSDFSLETKINKPLRSIKAVRRAKIN